VDQRRRQRDPLDDFLREQDIRIRHEQRLLRMLFLRVETVDALRAQLLEELADPKEMKEGESLREHLFWLGFVGDGHVLDEFLRLANPNASEDPLHLDLANHDFLGDPEVRRDFMAAVGLLGSAIRDNDTDRVLSLSRMLRRGLIDIDPDVQVAAAEALARSVKLSKPVFDYFAAAIDPLTEMLFSTEWRVRRAAIGALAELPDQRAMRALQRHEEREADDHLKAMTERSIRRLRDMLSHFRHLGRAADNLRRRIFGGSQSDS